VNALIRALEHGDPIVTTGLVLQELLQGFSGPRSRELILQQFAALPLLTPDRDDYVAAAELRNTCRRNGLQVGTIDALIAQLSVRYSLMLLTTDHDFVGAARFVPIKLWKEK
jgi:predicted nucleic acid-binding protein